MCASCGCDNGAVTIHDWHDHEHHDPESDNPTIRQSDNPLIRKSDNHPDHGHGDKRKLVNVEKDILYQNNLLAERNRGYFDARHIFSINLVSSPGSGKTTLLEQTLTSLKNELSCYVIEGDQQSTRDADRIHATGTPVVQINTGKGCHLDAHMVLHAIQQLDPKEYSVMFIENVGNLICPAMFDLGESARVVITSVTEGDDKPLKYPDMFQSVQLCIINKTDLLPYTPFDTGAFQNNALKVNPTLEFIEVSALKGDGMSHWYNWLHDSITKRGAPVSDNADSNLNLQLSTRSESVIHPQSMIPEESGSA